jgi:hypothetical protein
MKSSRITLIFLLVILGLLMITGTLLAAYPKIQENFADGGLPPVSSPIQIRLCPDSAPTIQTAIGNTDCCTGDLMNGKCNGKTVATLSPSHDGVPTVIDYWKQYFIQKGKIMCPANMPNFYEDITNKNGPSGCTASSVSTDGKNPTDTTLAQCSIYKDALSNETRANSCHNMKIMNTLRCPSLSGHQSTVSTESDSNGSFKYFACKYQTSDGLPLFCAEDKTFEEYLRRTNPNWKTSSQSSQITGTFCSNFLDARNAVEAQNRKLQIEQQARRVAEKARDAVKAVNNRLKGELNALRNKFHLR